MKALGVRYDSVESVSEGSTSATRSAPGARLSIEKKQSNRLQAKSIDSRLLLQSGSALMSILNLVNVGKCTCRRACFTLYRAYGSGSKRVSTRTALQVLHGHPQMVSRRTWLTSYCLTNWRLPKQIHISGESKGRIPIELTSVRMASQTWASMPLWA